MVTKRQDSDEEFPTPEILRRTNASFSGSVSKDADGVPLPRPPSKTKKDVFNLAEYADIDDHACNAPAASFLRRPLQSLVEYLLKPASTELAKVRVIYRWITAQDLSKLDVSGSATGQLTTTFDYLAALKKETVTYHKLMEDMCSVAKIKTELIRGHAKAAKHEPGDSFSPDSLNSSWTAVLVGNSWHLMDVHWSSKHVAGMESAEWVLLDDNGQGAKDVKKAKKEVHYEYDESYFLTDPEEFIYTHRPVDDRWQLLARPVSLEEFTQMAHLKPNFFEHPLRLLSHRKCVEYAPDGEITIELGLPSNTVCRFMYRLWMSVKGKENSSSYKGKELKRFVFMENPDGKKLSCKIEFPITGKFKLDLYCNNKSVSEMYQLVCAYVIIAERAKENARVYPENQRQEWGPGADLKDAGLKALTHQSGMVESETGETEMRFKAEKNVEILAKMHSDKRSKEDMERYVLHHIEKDEVIIVMKFPEADDYALTIYAKEKEGKEQSFPSVCSYLINARKPAADPTPFPEVPNGRLGSRDECDALRMKAISHPSALFEAPSTGQVDISFSTPVPAEFMADFKLYNDKDENKDLEGFTFIQKDKDIMTLKTRFPEKGKYLLNIYGKEKNKKGSFPLIFVYAIIVNDPMPDCRPFPKAYATWNDGCELLQPDISSTVIAGTIVPFSVKVPDASDVAIIAASNNKWTHLTKDSSGVWTGEVDTGNAGEELKLTAKTGSSSSYSTMLIFKVESPAKNPGSNAKNSEQETTTKQEQEKRERQRQEEEEKKKQKEEQERIQREKEEREKKAEIERERVKRKKEEIEKKQQEIEREQIKQEKEENARKQQKEFDEREKKKRDDEENEKKRKEEIEREKQTREKEEADRKRRQEIADRERNKRENEEAETKNELEGENSQSQHEENNRNERVTYVGENVGSDHGKRNKGGQEKMRLTGGGESKAQNRQNGRGKQSKENNDKAEREEMRRRKEEKRREEERERRRIEEEQKVKKEAWKNQFLVEELRKQMGEKEYRIQRAQEKKRAVQQLTESMKKDANKAI